MYFIIIGYIERLSRKIEKKEIEVNNIGAHKDDRLGISSFYSDKYCHIEVYYVFYFFLLSSLLLM